MNPAIENMLAQYQCKTTDDWKNALREILQQIALLGLWRGKFFEHAAFYGGTALRILYGLDRYSEDLDFSLLRPDPHFRLARFGEALRKEMESFGFNVIFESRDVVLKSNIDSAFLKTETQTHLLSIGAQAEILRTIHPNALLKIKLEIDIQPPPEFDTESKYLLVPVPYAVRVYTLPNLFAGKLHAVLCRAWRTRQKGRDWYDLVWYAARHPQVNLKHLESRMRQTGHYSDSEPLTIDTLQKRLHERIEEVNIDDIRHEVAPFLLDTRSLDIWSSHFFHDIASRILPTNADVSTIS